MGETRFTWKLIEDSGFAVLKHSQNTLIKQTHGTACAEPDLKPFLTNLETRMRATKSLALSFWQYGIRKSSIR
jgi:hypothetical protein